MSLFQKDQFVEKFALYLAVGFLGSNRVIEHLNGDKRKEQPTAPLYWRSKLLIPDSSRLLYHCGRTIDSIGTKETIPKILFFDITFEFNDKQSTQRPSSPRVLASLGFFLLTQKGSEADLGNQASLEIGGGHYVSTQPLDYDQLLAYINSLQLDRDSVSPEKLASSMVEELLRQESSLSAISNCKKEIQDETDVLMVDYHPGINDENGEAKDKTCSDSSSIDVTIPCKGMGDMIGKLALNCSPSGVSKFDSSALRFLSWDFSKNPNNFENTLWKNGEPLLSKKDLVDEAFDHWQMQINTCASNSNDEKNTGKQKKANPDVSTSGVDRNGKKDNERNKKRKSFKGMGILPSARRKRNKGLVYDTT